MSLRWPKFGRKTCWLLGAVALCVCVRFSLELAFRAGPSHAVPTAPTERKWLPDNALARFKHPHRVFRVAFAPDGKTLVTGTYDRRDGPSNFDPSLWGWDLKTKEKVFAFPCHDGRLLSLTISPDGTTVATVGEGGGLIRFWDLPGKKASAGLGHDIHGNYCVTFSPSGKLLAAVARDTVRVWEVATGRILQQWTWPAACRVAFSPDDNVLACVGGNVGMVFWDTGSGKKLFEGDLTGGNGISLVFSPDGQVVATGGNSVVQLSHVPSGVERSRFGKRIPYLAFSPNGRMLASGGVLDGTGDKAVHLWEVATGKERGRFEGHDEHILDVAFSPRGQLLASGSEDRTAIVWDLAARDQGQVRLTGEDGLELWKALASEDAAEAYAAIRKLTAAGPEAVPFIKEHLLKVLVGTQPMTSREVAVWIKNLNSDDPAVRQKALADLEQDGEAVLPILRHSLQQKPANAAYRQVELLVQLLPKQSSFLNKKPYSSEDLRMLRALEVLENIGTPAAQEVMQLLSQRAPDLRLAHEAMAALRRSTGR